MEKQDDRKRGKLREPLDTGKKVALIAEHLKKGVPGILYKSSTKNKQFFNRNKVFRTNKRVGINNGETNYYWVEKDGKRIQDRFFRQQLFALKKLFK